MTGDWRPCCGTCRSEKIGAVVVTRQVDAAEKDRLGLGPLAVAVATVLRCADCQTEWDGSELTDEEAAARPKPPWLPKMYEG